MYSGVINWFGENEIRNFEFSRRIIAVLLMIRAISAVLRDRDDAQIFIIIAQSDKESKLNVARGQFASRARDRQ